MMDGGLQCWEQWSRQWLAGEEKKKTGEGDNFFWRWQRALRGRVFFFPEEDLRVNQGRSLRMNEWSSEEGEQRSKREVHGEKAREKLCLRREPPRYEHSVFFIFLLPYFLTLSAFLIVSGSHPLLKHGYYWLYVHCYCLSRLLIVPR